ncbi:MAG: DUF4340 domain-containing protein, partial [Nitrospinaceae bacterium]|nr:DUF4340 domain-containing protein [Nitrospinaceae bacterium]NIR53350.1 DUF4340 domain-containing protein [Nitrospinaceae bacterium]NIT80549.1 DUF4340 domain-containing protein [Nitrospinaceae bacterium]NIU42874.1 DUF4340 domain-containing protein [Nitrospinaceae bacterium]NIU94946.1 DUF4340 domain-containing protein [Nitrospinaceae bacterium]
MKFRGTLWLALIFIGLTLYLVLVEYPTAKKKDEEETRSKQVLHFVVEDVQKFELIKKNETLKIQRNPDDPGWRITEPLAVRGEDGVINHLLLTLEEARITRVLEDPKDPAEFGLKDPSLKVALHFKTGPDRILKVGDPNPIGHTTFLQVEGEPRVLLAILDKNQLNQTVNGLRSKTLLDFVPREITAMDLQFNGQTHSLSKEGDVWKISSPVTARGDADEITNFLNSIRMERIENFLSEEPGNLTAYGLDQPRAVLHLKAEIAKKSWTLKIGEAANKSSFYAQREQPRNIITVSHSLMETLSKKPLGFMEKTLLTFKEEEVAELVIREGPKTLHIVRDPAKPGLWKSKDAGAPPVSSATVNTLLLDLQEARVHEFAPSNDPKLYGLEAPEKELSVTLKSGETQTLRLGNSDRHQRHYFATRSTDQMVFSLKADSANKIFRSTGDFRENKLMEFDPDKVAHILLEYPEKTFELEKQGKKWILTQPQTMEDIPPFIGNDVLWTLSHLEYESKRDAPPAPSDTRLDQPYLKIRLRDSRQKSVAELNVGSAVKGQPRLY